VNALICCLLSACASGPVFLDSPPTLIGHDIPAVEEPEFKQISPAMVEFIDRWVEQTRGKDQTTWSLVWAVTDQNMFRFKYDPVLTLPPLETFAQRQGNCLAFSSMFIVMARHLGLKAWYQEVEIPQQWNNDKDTLLVSMHVNVVVEGSNGSSWVVDVSGRANARSRLERPISDEVVLAQYYNNLGAEALTEGDLGKAYAYISKAIETEPKLHYLWSNIGVVYARNEQIDEATDAYLTALKIDSGSTMAANNLYLIYQKTGDLLAAAELEKRVEKNRRKNPYYLSYMSTVAFEEGRLDESRLLAVRAIALHETEYRFHYQLARTLMLEGRRTEAEASLQRALELAPDDLAINMTQLEQLPDLP
jgi:Flp pilus assembly protein TadD